MTSLRRAPRLPPLSAKAEAVLAYIRAHPGCTRREIRVALDGEHGAAEAIVWRLVARDLVREEEERIGETAVWRYCYWAIGETK